MADLRQSRTPKPRPNYEIPSKRRSIMEACENEDPLPLSRTNSDGLTQYKGISQGVRGSLRMREPRKSKNGWIINTGWQIPQEDDNDNHNSTKPTINRGLSEFGPQSQSWGNIQSPTVTTNYKDDSIDICEGEIKGFSIQDDPLKHATLDISIVEQAPVLPPTIEIREDELNIKDIVPESNTPAPLRIVKSASPAATTKSLHSSQRPEPVFEATSHNKISYSSNVHPLPGSSPPDLEQRPRWEDRGVPTYAPVKPPTPPTKVIMLEDDKIVGEMTLDDDGQNKGYNVQRTRNPNAPAPSEKVSLIAKAIAHRQNTAQGINNQSVNPTISFEDFSAPRPLPTMRSQSTIPTTPARPAYVPASQSWNTNVNQSYGYEPAPSQQINKPMPPIPTFSFDICDDPTPGKIANGMHKKIETPLPSAPSLLAEPVPKNARVDKDSLPPIPTFKIDDLPISNHPIPFKRNTLPPTPRFSMHNNQTSNLKSAPLPPTPTFAPNNTAFLNSSTKGNLPRVPTIAIEGTEETRASPRNLRTNSVPPISSFSFDAEQPQNDSVPPPPPRRALPSPSFAQQQQSSTYPSQTPPDFSRPPSRPLPQINDTYNQNRPLPAPQIQTRGFNHSHQPQQHQFQGQSQFNTHITTGSNRIPRSSALCTGCQNPITSRAVSAAGLRFHPECFTCSHCYIKLEHVAFFPEPLPQDAPPNTLSTGRFYCHCDFHELFSPRCKSCKTPIEGEVVVALGANYHEGHFFCAECGDVSHPLPYKLLIKN